MTLAAPAASDSPHVHADWMELQALKSPEGFSSIASLVRLFNRSGSVDGVSARRDSGSDISQRIAQDAFAEIEYRKKACGNGFYPFDVEPGLLRLRTGMEQSPYALLLLMSVDAPTPGHSGSAAIFERMCTEAALGYLGGPQNGANAIRFGSPRKAPYGKLSEAIDHLCISLSEGGGCRHSHKARHTGDDGLDVVAWRDFPDRQKGKLIAFGQCAGGTGNWEDKLTELDGQNFVRKWLHEHFVVYPVRLFFLPRRIPDEDWEHAGIDGGILFDRCRIIACLQPLSGALATECATLSTKMLRAVRQ